MSRPFDLVVFDLGGVLVRIASTWDEGHQLAGLASAPPKTETFRARLAELGARADGSLSAEQFCTELAAASDGAYTPDDIRAVGNAWLQGEYPDVASVFDALDATPLETAVLSNTNDGHWHRLAPVNGQAEFPTVLRADHLFASHLLGLMKPDPAIYRELERQTGHAPSRILFFDDLEANVRAARGRGWTAERIDPAGDPAAQMMRALVRYGVIPSTRAGKESGARRDGTGST